MFDKQYRFRGIHAVRVDALTSVFDEAVTAKLFERNVDVYTNAPLVGFLYNRRANVDDTKNPETNQIYNQNVMGDRVIYSQEELMFNFRLIMLLDKDFERFSGSHTVSPMDMSGIPDMTTISPHSARETGTRFSPLYVNI